MKGCILLNTSCWKWLVTSPSQVFPLLLVQVQKEWTLLKMICTLLLGEVGDSSSPLSISFPAEAAWTISAESSWPGASWEVEGIWLRGALRASVQFAKDRKGSTQPSSLSLFYRHWLAFWELPLWPKTIAPLELSHKDIQLPFLCCSCLLGTIWVSSWDEHFLYCMQYIQVTG